MKPRSTRWPVPVRAVPVVLSFALSLAASLAGVSLANAQVVDPTTPNAVGAAAAQEQRRLQERERAQARQLQRSPDVRLDAASVPDALLPLPTDEAPCFHITTLELNGAASEKFQWALKSAYLPVDAPAQASGDASAGRCLGSVGINRIMKRVQNALIERGFITSRVVAEPQDLRSRTLSLTLVPGTVRAVRFAEGSSARATKFNALPGRSDKLLNLRDIEQGLENFKRVPTAEVDMQIVPADGADAKAGESDIVVAWKQGRPVRLNASVDDSGTRATGKYQGNVTVSVDHGLQLNDLAYLSLNHDLGGGAEGKRGSRGLTFHYSVPLGYWLLAMNFSKSDYNQTVAGLTQNYLYKGNNTNHDLQLSRLVYRDAVRKTTVSSRAWTRSSKNYIDDTEVEVQRRRMSGWELGVAHREFIGAKTVDAKLAYRRGTGARGSMRAPEEAFGEGSSRARIITADVSLAAPFAVAGRQVRYTGTVRAQWNRSPLVPQDRFSIGGRYTVRGFDGESVLAADRGWLLRNDIGTALWNTGQEVYFGLDHGSVGGQSSANLAGKSLTGAVLGVRGAYKRVNYDVFAGGALHKPEALDASGVAGFTLGTAF